MLAEAHGRGIRIIVDLVPNHSSDQHVWFQAALAARPGSRERARYLFRDGKGAHGELPPNNWESVFGGPAWTRVIEADGTPGQWYLHLFDTVAARLRLVERRGARGVPPHPALLARSRCRRLPRRRRTRTDQGRRPARLHAPGGRRLDGRRRGRTCRTGVSPACTTCTATGTGCSPNTTATGLSAPRRGCPTLERTALWVRPDEMHQAFNFAYLETEWDAARPARRDRRVAARVRRSRRPEHVGALQPRRRPPRVAARAHGGEPAGSRHRPALARQADPRRSGLRRARAATTVMLALPGSAYIYQGEELGLPEAVDLPDEPRQDPTWFRTVRRALRPRRLPGAGAVVGDRAGLRLQPDRRLVAAAASLVGALARDRQVEDGSRRSRSTARCSPPVAPTRLGSGRTRVDRSGTRPACSHSATGM